MIGAPPSIATLILLIPDCGSDAVPVIATEDDEIILSETGDVIESSGTVVSGGLPSVIFTASISAFSEELSLTTVNLILNVFDENDDKSYDSCTHWFSSVSPKDSPYFAI